jgi:hypothetical protein
MHSRGDDPRHRTPATGRLILSGVDPEMATLLRYCEMLERAQGVAARIGERVQRLVGPGNAAPATPPSVLGAMPVPDAAVMLARGLISHLLQRRP